MLNGFALGKWSILVLIFGLLTFVAYALLVFRYVLEELTPGIWAAVIETLIVLIIVAFWVWGLLLASQGERIGLYILLICSLLPTLFTLYDLVFQSPIPYGWPLLQIVVWVTFLACAASTTTIILQLRN
jgi:hypothetical protein